MVSRSRVTHQLQPVAIQKLLNDPNGPIGKALLVRGYRVQARARQNLGGGTGTGPKRVDTGHLRASISVQLKHTRWGLTVYVGTTVSYAMWVHDGTGLYGPKHAMIKPTTQRYMRFKPKNSTRYVYAKETKGMVGNPFLLKALEAARIGDQK
jgi:hypothetical protein